MIARCHTLRWWSCRSLEAPGTVWRAAVCCRDPAAGCPWPLHRRPLGATAPAAPCPQSSSSDPHSLRGNDATGVTLESGTKRSDTLFVMPWQSQSVAGYDSRARTCQSAPIDSAGFARWVDSDSKLQEAIGSRRCLGTPVAFVWVLPSCWRL